MSLLSTFFKHSILHRSRSPPSETQQPVEQSTAPSSTERGQPSLTTSNSTSIAQVPLELHELQSSHLHHTDGKSSPPLSTSTSTPLRTKAHKTLERTHFLTLCWVLLLAGWNDGTSGPLLPRMQAEYKVGHLMVAVVFIANCFVSDSSLLSKCK
jgi:hypothetical protein